LAAADQQCGDFMTREPVVAGQFYPSDKKHLKKDLAQLIKPSSRTVDAIGAILPHAGYIYSGHVAGEVYGKLIPKEIYIVLSPNHTGQGSRFAISLEAWRTPLGEVSIEQGLAKTMIGKTSLLEEDSSAHKFEHSIEVQLPFIQTTSPAAKIVPMTILSGSVGELAEVAGAIAYAMSKIKDKAVMIASSDMTHYETRENATKKDKAAIARILDLDPEGLLKIVRDMDISMCGYIPSVIMLMAAKKLGATKAELVKYSDSGDVTGDTAQVVGYAGIIIY